MNRRGFLGRLLALWPATKLLAGKPREIRTGVEAADLAQSEREVVTYKSLHQALEAAHELGIATAHMHLNPSDWADVLQEMQSWCHVKINWKDAPDPIRFSFHSRFGLVSVYPNERVEQARLWFMHPAVAFQ